MFRHVVLFTWKPDATQEQKQALHDGLAKLPAAIDAVRGYRFGADAGLNPANRDFAVVADFEDEAGYLAYRDHPVHRDLVDRLVTPHRRGAGGHPVPLLAGGPARPLAGVLPRGQRC